MITLFDGMKSQLAFWLRDEEGASLVEYVLLVALIAVVCIVAVQALGSAARQKFTTTSTALQ